MEPTNIAEILRNAPVGTLLYSPMVGYVNLVGVYDDVGKRDIIEVEPQFDHKPRMRFDKYGKYVPDGERMLFPSKFKKDWDGWQDALFGFGHFITSTDKDAETMVITKDDLTKAHRSDGSCITICKKTPPVVGRIPMWRLCKRNNVKCKIMRREKQNTNSIEQTIANVKNPLMSKVLETLKEIGLEFSSLSTGDGYYIFEFGDETVCHFTVNGAKRWLFGIWAFEDETEGTHEKVCRVSLFGEHTDYIDKFKPTATKLSETFVVKDISEVADKYEVYEFVESIDRIKAHPALEKYFHYTTRTGSITKFLLSDFWFYRITNPLSKWLRNNVIWWYLRLVSVLYTIRFKRNGVSFKSDVSKRDENWHPMYEFRVIYGANEEDTVLSIYNKLQRERKNKFGYLETKHWLLPRCVENDTDFINAQDDNDWRGFYYPETDEND